MQLLGGVTRANWARARATGTAKVSLRWSSLGVEVGVGVGVEVDVWVEVGLLTQSSIQHIVALRGHLHRHK